MSFITSSTDIVNIYFINSFPIMLKALVNESKILTMNPFVLVFEVLDSPLI